MELTVSFKGLDTWILLLRDGTPLRIDTVSAPVRGMTQAERLAMIAEEFLRLVTLYEDRYSEKDKTETVKEVHIDPLMSGVKPGEFPHKARAAVEEACAGNEICFMTRIPQPADMADAKKVCAAYKLPRRSPVYTCLAMALGLQLTTADDRLLPAVIKKPPKKMPENLMEVRIPGLSQVLGKPLAKAKRGAPLSIKDLRLLILYTYGRAIMAKDREESFIIRNAQHTLMDLVRLEEAGKAERLETLANQLQKQLDESKRRGN